ncbi:hypothetical protein Pcinc_026977 [Petrolisthes cinctipes]|uniref:Uncharacterized protein n=1 Tax=Petrolisthes cinctipes TaxID=88211 RepID=A0AAE1F5Z6_PETCI|nr:hypothetical protein Pcinc_026977 [Petrolisthes cinctipes]
MECNWRKNTVLMLVILREVSYLPLFHLSFSTPTVSSFHTLPCFSPLSYIPSPTFPSSTSPSSTPHRLLLSTPALLLPTLLPSPLPPPFPSSTSFPSPTFPSSTSPSPPLPSPLPPLLPPPHTVSSSPHLALLLPTLLSSPPLPSPLPPLLPPPPHRLLSTSGPFFNITENFCLILPDLLYWMEEVLAILYLLFGFLKIR